MPRLPRAIPGRPIRAEDFNALAAAIEASEVRVGPGSGLGLHHGPNGVDLYCLKASLGLRIAKTTTIITAASGSTLGTGSIQIEAGSGTSIEDPGGTPPTPTVYSNDDQRVASGAYVVVAPFRDGYILLHARCGNLL